MVGSTSESRNSADVPASRAEIWARLRPDHTRFDIVVIGGGITGAGIACEAARRGLKTLLVEQRDYAWGTSSRSSKMVHGGLRYLGSGQYRLARDSVRERQRMLEEAPGLVDTLNFVTPHYRGQFPGPRVFGVLLWLYDRLAGQHNHRFYPGDKILQWVPGLNRKGLLGGSRFADAVTDDARLVLRLLDEARAAGATTLNYVKATGLIRTGESISGVELENTESGERLSIHAPVVVNATGAWTDQLRGQLGKQKMIRPLRGSHVVVPFWRLPVTCSVLVFHPDDGRPVFVFPWEGVTVIGTTDLDHPHDLDEEARISAEEVTYLLDIVPQVFPDQRIRPEDIRASWAGVRPVVSTRPISQADQDTGQGSTTAPSKEKREHALWDDHGMISVAGGKLTTFRLIALEVLEKARTYLDKKTGEPTGGPVFRPFTQYLKRPAQLSASQWQRLQGRFGYRLPAVLAAGSLEEIGGTGVIWAELVWAAQAESVVHLDDLLLRRTRLGLVLPNGAADILPQVRTHCLGALGWDEETWQAEVGRYRQLWQRSYSVPDQQERS